MKFSIAFIFITCVLIITSACSSTESIPTSTQPPPTETAKPPTPTDTAVPTSTPTSTPAPTDTPTDEPPTLTPTSTPFPPFRDEFSEILEPGWTWIRESSANWTLDENPGFLHILLDSHRPFEEVENILLRQAPQANFEITTRVLFTPYSNFQGAGLIIYRDDNAALFFRRAMCYLPQIPGACVGNGLYFDNYNKDEGSPESGYNVGSGFPTETINPSQAYLRLTREGRFFTAYYSDDGETWITVGTHEADLSPSFVGLIASGAFDHPAEADFDYFTLEELP